MQILGLNQIPGAAEQGYEMDSPSQIKVEMTVPDGQPVEIRTGSVATRYMQG